MDSDFFTRLTEAGPDDPPNLQLLFPERPDFTEEGLRKSLLDYHPTLADVSVELQPAVNYPVVVSQDGPPALMLGLVQWGPHRIKLITFGEPMPANAIEGCLQPALIPPEVKEEARAHRGHALLYYAGKETDPFEQRVALGVVAGAIARFDALLTLNEEARAAILSIALLPDDADEDMMQSLRSLPIPYFFGGFAKMELTDIPGVWIRTFACHRLRLPDLAYHAEAHDEGQHVFHLFTGVLGYLKETGLKFEIGEVFKIDDGLHFEVRSPRPSEWWLDSPGTLHVLEAVEIQE